MKKTNGSNALAAAELVAALQESGAQVHMESKSIRPVRPAKLSKVKPREPEPVGQTTDEDADFQAILNSSFAAATVKKSLKNADDIEEKKLPEFMQSMRTADDLARRRQKGEKNPARLWEHWCQLSLVEVQAELEKWQNDDKPAQAVLAFWQMLRRSPVNVINGMYDLYVRVGRLAEEVQTLDDFADLMEGFDEGGKVKKVNFFKDAIKVLCKGKWIIYAPQSLDNEGWQILKDAQARIKAVAAEKKQERIGKMREQDTGLTLAQAKAGKPGLVFCEIDERKALLLRFNCGNITIHSAAGVMVKGVQWLPITARRERWRVPEAYDALQKWIASFETPAQSPAAETAAQTETSAK